MSAQRNTTVDIVMEFLSLQNTRKEAAERLQPAIGPRNERLTAGKSAADKAIVELMNELSNFGDAVKSGVNKENEFYDGWHEVVSRLETLRDEEKAAVFLKMENDLYTIYLRVLREENSLPASLTNVLQTQAGELELGFQK